MINHARTLLMNVAGWRADEIGEEYVPESFHPVPLTPALSLVRTTLFGTNPDRLFMNYRTLQVMSMLHASELAEHVLALDKRVTYWPNERQRFFNATFGVSHVQHVGATLQVSYLGTPLADDRTGRSRDSWVVTFPEEGVANVQRTRAPKGTFVDEFQTIGGLSTPIPLHGSPLSIRVTAGSDAAAMIGAKLIIDMIGRPSLDLGDLDALFSSTIDRTLLDQIFYGDTTPLHGLPEPFRTFRNLWHDHPLMPYRLGGLLLGCIYRTEAIRQYG